MFLHLKFGSDKKKTAQEPVASAVATHEEEAPAGPAEVEVPVAPVARATPIELSGVGRPRIKTYFADSMRQAMLMASRDLGEDAVLIQSRPASSDRGGAGYEVTFGVVDEPPSNSLEQPREPESRDVSPNQTSRETESRDATTLQLLAALGSLQQEFALLKSAVFRSQAGVASASASSSGLSRLYSALIEHGVDPDAAAEWAAAVEERLLEAAGERSASEALHEHLSARIRTDDSIGAAVLLIGPPAAGKTTALMKLALDYGVRRGRRVEILFLNRLQAPPSRAMESMAGVLNIPIRMLPSASALPDAVRNAALSETLTLIEASGYGSGALENDLELASALRDLPVDLHLTLPATWSGSNIHRAVDRFEIFEPTRLLFTMVDLTSAAGPALQAAWRTGKALSFLCSGPLGSGPIEPASIDRLLPSLPEPPSPMEAI